MNTFPNLAGVATSDLVEQIGTGKYAADIEELYRVFLLDSESGRVYWRIRTSKRTRAGDEAGAMNKVTGYRHVRFQGKLIATHRVVFAMTHGRWPRETIDHINGIRLDNRPINLREATAREQAMNKGLQSNNKSGVPGVSFYKRVKLWSASIQIDGLKKHLGFYESKDEACEVRLLAEQMIFGAFRRRTA